MIKNPEIRLMAIQSRYEWADNIRFIALLSVIILHLSAPGLYLINKIPLYHWFIVDFTDSGVRFAAPLFFMISGALLLRNTDKPGDFYKKRLIKILYPFFFWSLIYTIYIAAFYSFYNGLDINLLGRLSNILFYKGIFARYAYHLWYVYVILGIYLITPLLKNLFVNQKQIVLIHFIIIWFIVILLNSQLFAFENFVKNIFVFLGYICYFVSGYFLTNLQKVFSSKVKLFMWIALVFLIFFTAFATYLVTIESNALDQEFFRYHSPNVVLMSVLAFVLISNFNIKNRIYQYIRDRVNKYSYGIYLLHALVLMVFDKFGLGWNFIHPFIGIPLVTLLTLGFSFVIIYLLNKIPILSRFAG